MAFTTPEFLLFFVTTIVIYYLIKQKYRWIWLLIASYVFYAFANWLYLFFLIGTTGLAYICGILLNGLNEKQEKALSESDFTKEQKKDLKKRNGNKKKWVVALLVLSTLSLLVFFKYYNFFGEIVFSVVGLFNSDATFSALSLIMPLGLSFYVFQVIGYIIDVYRGTAKAEKNYFKFSLFVSYFPQILQGPISRFNDLHEKLILGNKFDANNVTQGVKRMLIGFFKKLVLADFIAVFANEIFDNYTNYYGIIIALAVVAFAFQLYFDFSGFIDIALGVSKALGINLKENFDRPYFSTSISEFWRRWHITLGDWFRDYLYYPLIRSKLFTKINKIFSKKMSKKKAGKIPVILALMITWLSTGLWHGASWNFILWGLYNGIFIILEMLFFNTLKKIDKLIIPRIVLTFSVVCFGYFFFRATTVEQAFGMIGRIFVNPKISVLWDGTLFTLGLSFSDFVQILLGAVLISLIGSTNTAVLKKEKLSFLSLTSKGGNTVATYVNLVCLAQCIILTYCILLGLGAASNQFIYFQF